MLSLWRRDRSARRRGGFNAPRHDAWWANPPLLRTCASSSLQFARVVHALRHADDRHSDDVIARQRAPGRRRRRRLLRPSTGAPGLRQIPPQGLHGNSPATPRLHTQRIRPIPRLCRGVAIARRRDQETPHTSEGVGPLSEPRCLASTQDQIDGPRTSTRTLEMRDAGADIITCVTNAGERFDLEPTTSPLDSPAYPRLLIAVTGWRSIERSVERSRERSPRRSSSRELSPSEAPGERP